jgi:hypothetical protein
VIITLNKFLITIIGVMNSDHMNSDHMNSGHMNSGHMNRMDGGYIGGDHIGSLVSPSDTTSTFTEFK